MKSSILYAVVIPLLFFSCQEDVSNAMVPLNSVGEQFMELISTYGSWETDFEKIKQIGTPQPNDSRLMYNAFKGGGYYIMPVTRGKEIVAIVLYPIKMINKASLTTISPDIITKDKSKDNSIIQNLLNTDLFSSWLEKGYSVGFEKEDKATIDHLSMSRFEGKPNHQHVFCFELWWYVSSGHYVETHYKTSQIIGTYMQRFKGGGAEIRLNDEHCCVVFLADRTSVMAARTLYNPTVQSLRFDIMSVPYVENVQFYQVYEFEWKEEYEIGGGGGGGSESNPEYPSESPVVDPTGLTENWYIMCVYDKLSSKSHIFRDYLKRFKGENSIAHLKFEYGENLDGRVNGRFNMQMENYWLTIELNELRLMNSPFLMVAKTIMHEVIHANIFAKLMSLYPQLQPDLSQRDMARLKKGLDEQNYPTLYYYYEKYVYNATAQHQYMAQYNVDLIAAVLQDIDPSVSLEVRTAIAWEGLKYTQDGSGESVETEAWKALSAAEKQKLANALNEYRKTAVIDCND